MEASQRFSCLIFRDRDVESRLMTTRLDFMKTLYADIAASMIEIPVRGKSRLAKVVYLMILGDYLSCYSAMLRKIDPSPVDVITELKKRLAEI